MRAPTEKSRNVTSRSPRSPGAARRRAAVIAVLSVLTAAASTGPAHGVAAGDLDPLLRALSVRPWWGNPPAVSVTGLDGRRQSLDGLKGHAVLLYFWATW